MTDPAGTLEKALERNLLNVEHDRPLSRLRRDWTSLLVKSTVAHPISTKPAFQGVGSVPGGVVQCTDEIYKGETRDVRCRTGCCAKSFKKANPGIFSR